MEWKRPSLPHSVPREGPLETFLVEWKLLSVCKALKVLKVLETFLVEWKLSEYLFLFWA